MFIITFSILRLYEKSELSAKSIAGVYGKIKDTETFFNDISKYNKINVIHLRIEVDAILHWSKMNNTSEQNFKSSLENKYIDLFKKYISNTDQNIILSSEMNPKVTNFLRENNYNFRFIQKFFEDREKNAIVDFLVSKCCNNIFIGNGGSTFSFYIDKTTQNNIKKIISPINYIYVYRFYQTS
jgi:hypothetical protein